MKLSGVLRFAAFKIKPFFFKREKKKLRREQEGRHLITPLFKKGEFGVHNRLLFRVQWVGLRANVDVLLFPLNFT